MCYILSKGGSDLKDAIGQKLIMLRGQRSREQIAAALGISVSAMQMYENGRRVPRDEIKIKLADYYNVSVDELFFSYQNHVS
jgi:transcriptional regulator with XRE-family HTH domain